MGRADLATHGCGQGASAGNAREEFSCDGSALSFGSIQHDADGGLGLRVRQTGGLRQLVDERVQHPDSAIDMKLIVPG
jgi:hypothetical protein